MVLCAALGMAAGTFLSGLILYAWHNQTGSFTNLHACSSLCTCENPWMTRGVFVNCSHRSLPRAPTDLPRKTVQLDLSRNTISLLPNFCNLELLKLLDVSFNQLGDRGTAALKDHGLGNLEELRLVGNKITKVPMGLPPTLTFLDLCSNLITTISSALVADLPPLVNLMLGKNLLSKIKNEGFCPRFGSLPPLAKTLRYLDLKYNVIHTIQDGSFACLEALEYLDVSGNSLTLVGVGTFQGLKKLQHLAICKNSISQVSDGAFSEMQDLISLNLADNLLTYVPRHLPPKLELLDISNNAIVVLHEDDTLYRIPHIFVANNPLLCDCHIAWIKNQLVRAALPDNVKDKCSFPVWEPPDNDKAICDLMPRCARPSSVAGKPLNVIPEDMFECCESQLPGLGDSVTKCPMCSKRASYSPGLATAGHHRTGKTTNSDCPSMPDEKWVWVTPLDSRRIKVEWSLPSALEDFAVQLQYYMFGHRECKIKVKIAADKNQYILNNLRPNTQYVVCVVPQHCPNAHNPMLLDSCLEVRTKPLGFLSRLMVLFLGGTSCCHRNVGLLLLLLTLLSLALMSGHILRKLLTWWKKAKGTSLKEDPCRDIDRKPCSENLACNENKYPFSPEPALLNSERGKCQEIDRTQYPGRVASQNEKETCQNIPRTVWRKAETPSCPNKERNVNFNCNR